MISSPANLYRTVRFFDVFKKQIAQYTVSVTFKERYAYLELFYIIRFLRPGMLMERSTFGTERVPVVSFQRTTGRLSNKMTGVVTVFRRNENKQTEHVWWSALRIFLVINMRIFSEF